MSAEVAGLSKIFGGIHALDSVDLTVEDGEVHALLGANGSGKSTLVKCLSGGYDADAGTIRIGASSNTGGAWSPARAYALGLRIVYQDSPLINTLSVAEYFALATEFKNRSRFGAIRWRQSRRWAQRLLDDFDIPVDARTRAGALGPADRAMVSLALALAESVEGVELLVIDEVTAAMPEEDAMEFLRRVRRLPEMGIPVLMVTHRLQEVSAFADRVTVLAGGSVVHAGPASEVTEEELVNYMTARAVVAEAGSDARSPGGPATAPTLEALLARVKPTEGEAALAVSNLSGPTLEDVSFRLDAGEIVGLCGLPESGVGEVPRILAGIMRRAGGTIRVGGIEVSRSAAPAELIGKGVAVVPRDRHSEGGVQTLSIAENVTLPDPGRYWHRGKEERLAVDGLIEALDVRPADRKAIFGTLSGGNQQKVVVGKWLLTSPTVLVLDDPTVGVDPAARQQLFAVLHDAAERGLAALILSSEPEQLAAHCSRVLVMRQGKVAAELAASEFSSATLNEQVARLSAH